MGAPSEQACLPPAASRLASAGTAVRLAAAVIAPLVTALAVLGGIGSFATVRNLAVPWFGGQAWIVPAGVDAGILALLAWDLLAEYLGLSWPVLRWTAWCFIAATVYLNISAAHRNPTAAVMHAAMPVLFVTVIEGFRHLTRRYAGLISGTRIERVPLSRWLLAPRSTFILARHMVLWHITSYHDGLDREHQRLITISQLQQDYGRWLWRWRAPLEKRLALRLPEAGTVSASNDDKLAPDGPAVSLPPSPLIQAAASLLAEAEHDGTRLSQAVIARRLRELGHHIGNDRLRDLIEIARRASGAPMETA